MPGIALILQNLKSLRDRGRFKKVPSVMFGNQEWLKGSITVSRNRNRKLPGFPLNRLRAHSLGII